MRFPKLTPDDKDVLCVVVIVICLAVAFIIVQQKDYSEEVANAQTSQSR